MIRNRKISQLETLSEHEIKHAELLFDLYIVKKWYYVGGNHEHHLRHFEILCKDTQHPSRSKEDQSCYLCQRNINPYRIYYIKNYEKDDIQKIGRCCYWMYDINKPYPVLPKYWRQKQKTD
jgi:hypothetical protein